MPWISGLELIINQDKEGPIDHPVRPEYTKRIPKVNNFMLSIITNDELFNKVASM